MYIGIVGPIATSDLLTEAAQQAHKSCPKGRAGAPLVSNLIKEYIARGHQVLAVTIDPKMDDDAEPYVYTDDLLTYVIAPSRQRIFRPNGWRMGRTADFYRFERQQMLAILERYKPDVVHAHWTYEFALAALAYSPNALITIHDNALIISKYVRTLERLFMLIMARQVFKKGQWFTAVSPYMAESIQNMTAKPIAVVANPVPIPAATPKQALPSQPVISVVVNGWDDRKNSANALLAFKELQKRHPTCVLWAMGTAFEPNGEAVAFCTKHDIQNVVFYGSMRHTEVLSKIAASTLLLHASLEESFGMVLVEAMSYGVPVVAGKDSGAVAWVVDDGGLLVDVTRVDAIVTATDKLLSDSDLYSRTSKRAIAIVRDRFPIEAIADQYIDLYRKHNVGVSVEQLT
ncbi:glycosyltransferase family 4 protein [Spirosoma utsteinense]|uniref:Glycosyltransferase involved in cell wall biosynthesis n=1 Tax=Spirosoma utsteinense TaxID=2585773 RepID=A0ABR6W7Y5_9BACT|nr:glycosyltransferase family 4 protein [Spirosoma utsteinense]MBC3787721.1 glycosyltransferase involved in cell wall biosynthesis [Spirosoma utsteinense]MBC3792675.1 glycosyltransferase involved in cell wall biosynthesis [Spirosoma utsteinense]